MLDVIRTKARSFGVMLIFGIIILVFVFWGMGNIGGMSSRILAVVNGEKISVEDFNKSFQMFAEEQRKQQPDFFDKPEAFNMFKRQVLAEIIKQRLLMQEAEKLGLMITPQELRKALEGFAVFHDASGKFDQDAYLRVLRASGQEPGTFEADYAKSMLEDKLMRYIGKSSMVSESQAKSLYEFSLEKRKAQYVLFKYDDYLPKADISDEEARKEYDAGKESYRVPERAAVQYLTLTPESLAGRYAISDQEAEDYYKENIESFRKPERFQASHISVAIPQTGAGEPSPEEKRQLEQAFGVMDKVLDELRQGKDFSDLALKHSQGQDNGKLGWQTRGSLGSKEFEDAALALKPGEVSEPIRTELGLHLIKLDEKEESSLPSFADVKADIVKTLSVKKADADFAEVQKEAENDLALNLPLQDIAAKFGLKVSDTGLMSDKELEGRLGLQDDSRVLLADAIAGAIQPLASGMAQEPSTSTNATAGAPANATAGSPAGNATAESPSANSTAGSFATPAKATAVNVTIPVPLNIQNGVVLVRVKEVMPSHIPSFGEMRPSIIGKLKIAKSHALARTAAEEALPSFTGKTVPQGYADKVKVSEAAARVFPALQPLGVSEPLLQGLFSSTGEWLPSVYEVDEGVVIARVFSVEPVKEGEWEQYKDIFIAQFGMSRTTEVQQVFMLGLDERADVQLYLEVLDSLAYSRRGR